jgi:hypothetical protein
MGSFSQDPKDKVISAGGKADRSYATKAGYDIG